MCVSAASIQACVYMCVFVSSCQATMVLIIKYLAAKRVAVSVGRVKLEWVRKATAYKFP